MAPAIFKFKAFKWMMLWAFVLYPCAASFMVYGLHFSSGSHYSFFVSTMDVCIVGIAIVSFMAVADTSDILVDEVSISRRFICWTWKSFEWASITKIRFFQVPAAGERRQVVAVNIFSKNNRRKIRMTPSGKMIFSEKVDGAKLLFQSIDYYVKKYNIDIIDDKFLLKSLQ